MSSARRPWSLSLMRQMDGYLAKHSYFSGTDQPGLGDFMFLFPLFTIIPQAIEQGDAVTETARGKLRIGDNLRNWWKRVEARYVVSVLMSNWRERNIGLTVQAGAAESFETTTGRGGVGQI